MGLRSVVSVLYVSDSPGSIFFGREVGSRVSEIDHREKGDANVSRGGVCPST